MDIHRARFVDYTPEAITSLKFSHESTDGFTPGDLRLAVGKKNGDIEIWNPRNNWCNELVLNGGKDRNIEGLCWSHFDNYSPRLFSIGGSTYITEWDLATGKPIRNFDCNSSIIFSIDINETGDKIAVGCDNGVVVIVDISGGPGSLEYETSLQRTDSTILSIAWYKDEMVIGGCSDGKIRCWSFKTDNTKNRLLSTMKVDKSKTESTLVWSVVVLKNKKQIVTGDSTGSVKFWDLEHFSLLQNFKVHDFDVLCLTKDFNEDKIFSSGIDRKIFNFNLVSNNNVEKWVTTSNRVLHSGEVRSIASFESKNGSFLVSGGLERSIVINSIKEFQDGQYRKLPITKQKPNVLVNQYKRLVVMWHNQTVKIWRIRGTEEDRSYKLVSKLVLNEEENIATVELNKEGTVLAVGTAISLKLFHLEEYGDKLKVRKFRDEKIDELIDGVKLLKFNNDFTLTLVTVDEETILTFNINKESLSIELIDEIEVIEQVSTSSKSKLSYYNNINNFEISENNRFIAVSRFNGTIEILSTDNSFEPFVLTKLSSYSQALKFTKNQTLLVINNENKLYEFNINNANGESLLTTWSTRNSEFLPKEFVNMKDKVEGIFVDELNSNRIWIYGSSWLSFFDLSLNLPISKASKNKKRGADGLNITDDLQEEEDEDLGIVDEQDELLFKAVDQSKLDRLKSKFIKEDESQTGRAFWLTSKYRPILKVDNLGANEMIVVERPPFYLPTTPAFVQNQIRV